MNTFLIICFIALSVFSVYRLFFARAKDGNSYEIDTSGNLPDKVHTQENRVKKRSFFIVNERPANWSFEKYRRHLVKQKKYIKNRARLCYVAVEIKQQTNAHGIKELIRRTWQPFKGDTHKLKNI